MEMNMRKYSPRKFYDPRACITRRLPLDAEQARDLGIAYHASLQAILNGKGTEQAWGTLACALNIALILCEQGIGEDHTPTIKQAQASLMNCRERAQRANKWGFNGDEARAIMRAFAIHDEQIALANKGQIVAALKEVHRRIEIGEVMA
jgi:hypothetical protein